MKFYILLGLLALSVVSSTSTETQCHPQCSWKCDDPHCPAICDPVCEPPKCHTSCAEPKNAICDVKCEKPECEIKCPDESCETIGCPACTTTCKPLHCVSHCQILDPNGPSHCQAPIPECSTSCEPIKCDYKCHEPVCPEPICELQCEQPSPVCQEQL